MNCPSCGAANPDDAQTCSACGTAVASAPAIAPGFLLASRYEILKVLGRGGMGMVYQARDRLLEETVAIKVLRPDVAATPDIARRFRAEIKIARSVSHKNVGRIHEYGEDRGLRYISMAYVDGVDLKQVLRERGPLPPAEAFEIVIRVADALQAIHDEGIVHRDLKAPNIMLDRRGVVRLMDFGIAKQHDAEGLSMTATGQIIGTPEYMSPEQVQALRLDGRSDIYSLGVVVFELFTGRTPFRADTPLGTVLKHLNEPPPLEGEGAAGLPPALVPVLRKALAKKREERYASAHQMAQALEEARALTTDTTHRLERTVKGPYSPGQGETFVPTLDQKAPAGERAGHAEATRLLARPSRWRRRAVLAGGAGSVLVAATWALLRPAPSAVTAPAASVAPSPLSAPSSPPAAATPAPSAAVAPPQAARARVAVPARPTLADPGSPPVASVGGAPSSLPIAPGALPPPAGDARVDRLLAEAERALEAESFDAAIARYDEVLAIEARNAVARMGRTAAVSAKVARAPARPPAVRSFVAEKTRAESAETRPDAALASAFEEAPGIAVTRDSQAATLPGRIEFKTDPEAVRPGERYKLEVRFVNAGTAPIGIAGMVVSTTVNGRNAGGPVTPSVSTVAPGQTAPVLSLSDALREDLESWELEVQVRTTRGETYRNRLAWTDPDARKP